MAVSAEKLAEVDAELEALGRSSGEIEAVLARFEAHEPEDLDAVDAALADLSSGVDFVMPEPAAKREPSPKRERGRKRAASRAPVPAASVDDDVDPDDMPTVESADRAGSRLSEEDLFGDTPSDEPPAGGPKDYSYLFGPDSDLPPPGEDAAEGDALLESLEAEIDGFQAPPPGGDDEADPTHVFSSSDLESIERDAMESARPPRADGRRPSDVPSARPARPPSQRPPSRDPEFDALLGDPDAVFRPSQHPPAEQASADEPVDMGTGDFEVLVDDDILVEVDEDPLDALPSVVPPAASQAPPVPPMPRPPAMPAATASPSQRPSQRPEGDEEEGGQKKGFFKKLFGGKE